MYKYDSQLYFTAGLIVNFVVTTLSSYCSCFHVITKIPDHQHAVSVFRLHLCTNTVFSFDYKWDRQSCCDTLFLPLKKEFSAIPSYL